MQRSQKEVLFRIRFNRRFKEINRRSNGNFVVMPTVADMESPTITMSDEELEIIKNASS